MENTDGLCKHGKISRNCYPCHLEYTHLQEKTHLDTLYEKISELMVRVSKLEQYARLQADHNDLQREINATLNDEIKELKEQKRLQDDTNRAFSGSIVLTNEHRLKQIDENRAVSKHLTDLDESYQGLFAEVSYLLGKSPKKNGLTFEESMDDINKMNVNIPKVLHKKMKQKALDEDTTVTELVIKALWDICE